MKLEQELENARKEKSMVYVAGVGFQAQENKAKVKEAKQNLNNYLDKQHIEDLRTAQQKETELVEEVIKKWQDMKELVDFAKQTADTEAALRNLINTGFINEGSTVQQALRFIYNSTKSGLNGKITSLGNTFNQQAEEYTNFRIKMQDWTDSYENKITAIAEGIQNDLEDEEKGLPAIQQKMDQNTANVSESIRDLWVNTQAFQQALADLAPGKSEDVKVTVESPDYTAITTRIDKVKDLLEENLVSQMDLEVKQYQGKNTTFSYKEYNGKYYLASNTSINSETLEGLIKKIENIGAKYDAEGEKLRDKLLNFAPFGNLEGDTTNKYGGNTQGGTTISPDNTGKVSRDQTQAGGGSSFGVPLWTDRIIYNTDEKDSSDQVHAGGGSSYAVPLWTDYLDNTEKDSSNGATGRANGIEGGPIPYTGLVRLHGSPSNPEYVLNNKQAYTLLRNLSTMQLSPYRAPSVASYHNGDSSSVVYEFNGDINLPNVQKPDEFFSELLRTTNTQFGTVKTNYQY